MKKKGLLVFLISIGLGVLSIIYFREWRLQQDCIRIPITDFDALGEPIIEVEFEGIGCSLGVDLGLGYEVQLRPEFLSKIKNKRKIAVKYIGNIFNNNYKTQSFSIPSMKVQSWEIKDLLAVEMVKARQLEAILYAPSEEIRQEIVVTDQKVKQGVIGWPIFSKFHCFFNLGAGEIFFGKSSGALERAGCSIAGFIKVPFSFESLGVIISVETDLGSHRYILDTGATSSAIRERLVDKDKAHPLDVALGAWEYTSSITVLNGYDFGESTFRLFPMADAIDEFDGALGMDFFKKHAIYFDFQNQVAYIQPTSKPIPSQNSL